MERRDFLKICAVSSLGSLIPSIDKKIVLEYSLNKHNFNEFRAMLMTKYGFLDWQSNGVLNLYKYYPSIEKPTNYKYINEQIKEKYITIPIYHFYETDEDLLICYNKFKKQIEDNVHLLEQYCEYSQEKFCFPGHLPLCTWDRDRKVFDIYCSFGFLII